MVLIDSRFNGWCSNLDVCLCPLASGICWCIRVRSEGQGGSECSGSSYQLGHPGTELHRRASASPTQIPWIKMLLEVEAMSLTRQQSPNFSLTSRRCLPRSGHEKGCIEQTHPGSRMC